jgi:hypothetical protein
LPEFPSASRIDVRSTLSPSGHVDDSIALGIKRGRPSTGGRPHLAQAAGRGHPSSPMAQPSRDHLRQRAASRDDDPRRHAPCRAKPSRGALRPARQPFDSALSNGSARRCATLPIKPPFTSLSQRPTGRVSAARREAAAQASSASRVRSPSKRFNVGKEIGFRANWSNGHALPASVSSPADMAMNRVE